MKKFREINFRFCESKIRERKGGISGETQIIINDIQGRTINTIINKPVNSQIEQTIDLTKLSKGIYFINIKNANNSKTQKLIVQ